MIQNEIIEMARQAGAIPVHKDPKNKALVGNENIEYFAKLVAAKEREWLIGYIRIHQPSCEQMANAIRARGEA